MFRSPAFLRIPLMICALCVLGAGCDMTELTADTTSGLFERAAPAFEQYWDYDIAGRAAPAAIVQLEGILRVVPDNEKIILQLIRSYTAYGFGWIEDAIELAEIAGDFEEQERQTQRARLLYQRARDLSHHWLSLHAEGMEAAMGGGVEPYERWVQTHFADKAYAELLLWAGYSWGSFINMSREDMEAVADLDYAKTLVKRSIELDPSYYYATGYTFLGVATAQDIAPDLDRARSYFDTALELSKRRALLTQVSMARYYAVKKGDKKLFTNLLEEVLAAEDILPENRLANVIARRRAQRYLERKKEFF